jgi:hypothetical protein
MPYKVVMSNFLAGGACTQWGRGRTAETQRQEEEENGKRILQKHPLLSSGLGVGLRLARFSRWHHHLLFGKTDSQMVFNDLKDRGVH